MATTDDWQHGWELTARNAWTSREFQQGLALLRRAADKHVTRACLALGHVYARVPRLADAAAQCAHWYLLAAEQGDPVAQDRIADLCMLGYGIAQDDIEAFRWYERTADQAYPHACCNLAYMLDEGLGTSKNGAAAAEYYLRAAALADARGLFNLGMRYARAGTRDLSVAYACIALATYARYPGAEVELTCVEDQMDPTMREQGRTLAGKLRLCLRGVQQHMELGATSAGGRADLLRFAWENLATLKEPAFTLPYAAQALRNSRAHSPGEPLILNAAPRIFSVDEFVSREECAHLLTLAAERFEPARETRRDRLSGEQNAFTGDVAVLGIPDGDAVVRNIERRIGAAFHLPATHVEPVSILRYACNDSYAPHVDYFSPMRLQRNVEIGDYSGQRVASFLVYLQAPELGGETHYLKVGKKIAGKSRMALCHSDLAADGTPDEMTLHTGEPVLRGEKWLARTTLRERPFF